MTSFRDDWESIYVSLSNESIQRVDLNGLDFSEYFIGGFSLRSWYLNSLLHLTIH